MIARRDRLQIVTKGRDQGPVARSRESPPCGGLSWRPCRLRSFQVDSQYEKTAQFFRRLSLTLLTALVSLSGTAALLTLLALLTLTWFLCRRLISLIRLIAHNDLSPMAAGKALRSLSRAGNHGVRGLAPRLGLPCEKAGAPVWWRGFVKSNGEKGVGFGQKRALLRKEGCPRRSSPCD
jgi:hypothetical protein